MTTTQKISWLLLQDLPDLKTDKQIFHYPQIKSLIFVLYMPYYI